MTFKVFSFAWYVEAEVIATSPTFIPYRDQPYETLAKSDDFFSLMTQPGEFDRTLFIKLAMTLKRDLVIQGLLEELLIEPKNAVSYLIHTFGFYIDRYFLMYILFI